MSYLQSCQFTEIRSSQNINADFPDINCASGVNQIAGLLLIPLNGGGANDFLVFFRKSQLKHIKWAGYVKISFAEGWNFCSCSKVLS
jgi:light-regulated signal transduction histidine kinase (bacteriophytochrome)